MMNFGPLPRRLRAQAPLRPYTGGNYGPLSTQDNTNTTTLFNLPATGNGATLSDLPSTDLHLVTDDIILGQNWLSRVGSLYATTFGSPIVDNETPFYINGGFTGSGYRKSLTTSAGNYQVAYDVSHELTNTSTKTFVFIIQTGDFVSSEVFASYGSGLGFNFYFAALDVLGAPTLETRVQCATTDAVVQYPSCKYTFYAIKITYDGATNTLSMAVNGVDWSSSIGIGNPISGVGNPLYIGDNNLGFPLVTAKLLEFQRHDSILSTANWFVQLCSLYGVRDTHSINPVSFSRDSKAGFRVNNKIWQVGPNWPRVTELGYLTEGTVVNLLQNSIFSEPFGTGFTSFNNVSYQSDVDDYSCSGGTGLKITNDLLGTLSGVFWTHAFLGASVPSWFSFEWKPLNVGSNAYYLIYNSTTGNYYNALTAVWGASIVYNPADPSSGEKVKTDIIFNNDSVGGTVLIYLLNASEVNENEAVFFLAQFYPSFDTIASPFIYEGTAPVNLKYEDILIYPSSIINYSDGSFECDATLIPSSSDPVSYDRIYTGALNGFIKQVSPSADFIGTDNTNTASIAVPHNRMQSLKLKLSWVNGGNLVINEKLSGLSNTTTFTAPLDSGDVALGCNNSGLTHASVYLKNIKIR